METAYFLHCPLAYVWYSKPLSTLRAHGRNYACLYCEGEHSMEQCKKLKKCLHKDKLDFLKGKGWPSPFSLVARRWHQAAYSGIQNGGAHIRRYLFSELCQLCPAKMRRRQQGPIWHKGSWHYTAQLLCRWLSDISQLWTRSCVIIPWLESHL